MIYDTISIIPVSRSVIERTAAALVKREPGACQGMHTGTTAADWDEWDWCAIIHGNGCSFWILPPERRYWKTGKPVDDEELTKTICWLDLGAPELYATGSPDFIKRVQEIARKKGIRIIVSPDFLPDR